MRLIDANKFKQQIAAITIRDNLVPEKSNAICELIDKQPTAYDLDKVIEQLEERIESFKSLNSDNEIVNVAIKEIQINIEIIKSGCIE